MNAENEQGLTPDGERRRGVQRAFGVDRATGVDAGVPEKDRADLKTSGLKEMESGELNGAAGQNPIPWNTASGNSFSPLDLQRMKMLTLYSSVLVSHHNLSGFLAQ